jgi:hypothetical protein
MELSAKVTGKIEEVSDKYLYVVIKGKLDRLVIANPCCETEAVLILRDYPTVVIEGNNPYVDKFEENLVFVTGELTGVKLYNQNGELVKAFKIVSCCLKLKPLNTKES